MKVSHVRPEPPQPATSERPAYQSRPFAPVVETTLAAGAPAPHDPGRLGHSFEKIAVGRRPTGSENTGHRDEQDPAKRSNGHQPRSDAEASIQRKEEVIQRLIVLDGDMDTGRVAAAYNIWKSRGGTEAITTIGRVAEHTLVPGETIFMVAHGDGDRHGGRDAEDLAKIMKGWGLDEASPTIRLISCHSGDNDDVSFAAHLAGELDFAFKVVGIRGLESTDEAGVTRGEVVDKEGMAQYTELLDGNKEFQAAEAMVKVLQDNLATCEPGKEIELIVETMLAIEEITAAFVAELRVLLEKVVTLRMSQDESEYIFDPEEEVDLDDEELLAELAKVT